MENKLALETMRDEELPLLDIAADQVDARERQNGSATSLSVPRWREDKEKFGMQREETVLLCGEGRGGE